MDFCGYTDLYRILDEKRLYQRRRRIFLANYLDFLNGNYGAIALFLKLLKKPTQDVSQKMSKKEMRR